MNVTIHTYSMREEKWFPRQITIPEDKEQAFRQQAERNHGQTVERLNQRGGMAPIEIYWAYKGMRWNSGDKRVQHMQALQLCVDLASDKQKGD